MKKEIKTKVVTKVVRLAYTNIYEPKFFGGIERYSTAVIIDENDYETLDKIEKAIEAALEEGKNKFPEGKIPDKALLKLPLRDGNEMDDEAFKNKYFLNASSITQPEVVDKYVRPIMDKNEIYSGVYARVSLNFYAFNKNNNMGVGCGLLNIQKIKDGEKLSGLRTTAKEDFTVVEDDFLD